MGFHEDIAGDAEDVLAEQGQDVTHTPHGGVGVTLTAIWDPDATLPEYVFDGEQDVKRGVAQLSSTVTVTDRDSFTIDGVVYAVAMIRDTRWLTECQLVAREKRRVGGANSRLQR